MPKDVISDNLISHLWADLELDAVKNRNEGESV